MVDGVSDQFAMGSRKSYPQHAIALSYKSRSAIAMAGKLGKAIWYDNEADEFTSSTAYFKKLPTWLNTFNTSGMISRFKKSPWRSLYPLENNAYAMHDPRTYKICKNSPLTNNTIAHNNSNIVDDDDYAEKKNIFLSTPAANQLLLNLAQLCIEEHIDKKKTDRLLLWVSLSCLDKLGHAFGPESIEAIDMLYHLDKQIDQFIAQLDKQHGKDFILILTADHGVTPIAELIKKKGFGIAGRTNPKELIKDMNAMTYQQHGIDNIVANFNRPSFYLNKPRFLSLPEYKQTKIMADLKRMITDNPCIMRAWTDNELSGESLANDDIANYFKQQRFPGRNGDITVQPFPYTILKRRSNRASHNTPYYLDTHVPLIIYQPTNKMPQVFNEQVAMLRFAPTIAHLMDTQRPSACTASLLPGFATTPAPLPQEKHPDLHHAQEKRERTRKDRRKSRARATSKQVVCQLPD